MAVAARRRRRGQHAVEVGVARARDVPVPVSPLSGIGIAGRSAAVEYPPCRIVQMRFQYVDCDQCGISHAGLPCRDKR